MKISSFVILVSLRDWKCYVRTKMKKAHCPLQNLDKLYMENGRLFLFHLSIVRNLLFEIESVMYKPKWKKLAVHYKNLDRFYLQNGKLFWFDWIFVYCMESVVFYSFCIVILFILLLNCCSECTKMKKACLCIVWSYDIWI